MDSTQRPPNMSSPTITEAAFIESVQKHVHVSTETLQANLEKLGGLDAFLKECAALATPPTSLGRGKGAKG